MSTFIARYETSGPGIRLAVKDLIDIEGEPTTAGCRALAEHAEPATADAACLAGARRAGARIVGKTNLSELAFDAIGANQWYGTPVNPLDHRRIPGGSSSGSAVAVGTGEADVAYGSDTGGSVRIPSACCGTVGLKTTFGRIPLAGVWPLAQSLDTIGPMAADVAGVVAGMGLLEEGFTPAGAPARVIGRLRPPDVDPAIDQAVDPIITREAWINDHHLLAEPTKVSERIAARVASGAAVTETMIEEGRRIQDAWRAEVTAALARVELLALPTLLSFAPFLGEPAEYNLNALTSPFNVSGSPALAMPVPAGTAPLPGSLQLVGPLGGEEMLCATAAVLAAAVGP